MCLLQLVVRGSSLRCSHRRVGQDSVGNCRPHQLSPHRCVLSLLCNALMFVLFITYNFIMFLLYFRAIVTGCSGRSGSAAGRAHTSHAAVHADCTQYATLIAHFYFIALYACLYLYLYCFVCFAVYLLCLCIVIPTAPAVLHFHLKCIYSILFIFILFHTALIYLYSILYIFYSILFSAPNNNAIVQCAHLHASVAPVARRHGTAFGRRTFVCLIFLLYIYII